MEKSNFKEDTDESPPFFWKASDFELIVRRPCGHWHIQTRVSEFEVGGITAVRWIISNIGHDTFWACLSEWKIRWN